MNNTIRTILNHRSVRHFKSTPVPESEMTTIIEAAQAASTSSFLQAYSIIAVTEKELKQKLAEAAGNQEYVEHNGAFLVFCADMNRAGKAADMTEKNIEKSVSSTEGFMVSIIDAALAAQNAAIAAESSGLGICYIGGIRNDLPAVSEWLDIPDYVLPLFGMAIGYPESVEDQKPRLPHKAVVHYNRYNNDSEAIYKILEKYDTTIFQYYQSRSRGRKKLNWTGQITSMLEKGRRLYMNEFVKQKGFIQE
ncbi:oxygen-insensitive NADPH nitroreductase [Alteribacillus sp. HJP-4]|uniref:oxygen-insensitive NADPH nitroreductase n=1 Tax=Alteribacillus sp. HJP-4 TaxID=2775394 RepID=UPI0035CD219E